MKIVVATWRDLAHQSAGGAEVMIDRLLCGLTDRGHHVTLVCGGPTSPHPFEVVDAGGTYSQYIRAPWICLSRFRDADVVVDVENGLPYFSPLWRRRPSICLTNHIHTDQWETRFPRPVAACCSAVEARLMPIVYRNRRFVAISRSTAEALVDIGVHESAVTVIEPGVDFPSGPVPSKSDKPLFLSLNRLVPHKRVDLLLKAWSMACETTPGQLVVVGDGPELDDLRRLAATIPRAEVRGRVSEEEKQDLLARTWAVVSAAHHEGWGLSIMEAAALATPALAVDAPGLRDAIVDGATGVLVRSRDETQIPEALARAMNDLVNDDERRHALGRCARQRARVFSWDHFVDQWESVLEDACAPRSNLTRRTGRKAATSDRDSTRQISAVA
jgi:glycosyltransferase involved in cell wall biosynthesis